MNWSLGSGGVGGDETINQDVQTDGTDGTATSFGSYTSADGSHIPTGYIVYGGTDVSGTSCYALGSSGADGVDGYDGGDGGSPNTDVGKAVGANAEDYDGNFRYVQTIYRFGGQGGKGIIDSTSNYYGGGGGGGGGCGTRYLDPTKRLHGQDGEDAFMGTGSSLWVGGGHGGQGEKGLYYNRNNHGHWGRGGRGADGAGGGGGGGGATNDTSNNLSVGGDGGAGWSAKAGEGGDYGCIYIFY